MPIITSRGTITVDGLGRLPVLEGTEVQFGNLKREAVLGDDGFLGHSEKYETPAGIKCTLADTTELDKDTLRDLVGVNVLLQTNNGQAFLLKDAFVANPLALQVQDGKLEVEFQGSELIQQA